MNPYDSPKASSRLSWDWDVADEVLLGYGLKQREVKPWLYRLIRLIGVPHRPPIYATWVQQCATSLFFFFVMYFPILVYVTNKDRPLLYSVGMTVFMSVTVSAMQVWHFRRVRVKKNIPDWDEYVRAVDNANNVAEQVAASDR